MGNYMILFCSFGIWQILVAFLVLSRGFLDFCVCVGGGGAFVKGLSQISSFFYLHEITKRYFHVDNRKNILFTVHTDKINKWLDVSKKYCLYEIPKQ